MAGVLINDPVDSDTDVAAIRNHKISITPLTYQMTTESTLEDLSKVLCRDNLCNWF
jgi:broad specificity polyphosphatase/5'/3'-nucleotidase SurE